MRPIPDRNTPQSKFTGWTRWHWETQADRLLSAAWHHSSPGHAQVTFPSGMRQDATDRLEGFARTFLLGALRLAGSRGQCTDIAQWYAGALDAGTAPGSAERWPDLVDHGQPTVEATAIVLALQWSRPWIWDQLPLSVRDNVAFWLAGATGRYGADNNHVMFGATIQAFLASTGYPHDPFEIEAALARIDDWYAGDGWYSDGPGRRFDHYNAWTFQLYPFFILDLLEETGNSARRALYRRRLDLFVDGYQHLFGADGSPLIQGRSLTYRWGVVAPFWMAQLEGIQTVSPGRTRRLANGVLQHFLDRGAADDGVLSLGWHGAHSDILQSYNAPGSPHWASKGFLGLLLPADHPVWTAPEEPLPVELADTSVLLVGPRWHITGTRSDGVIRALNFGSDGHPQNDDALYRRLAFSTATITQRAGQDGFPLRDNDVYIRTGSESSRHRGLNGGTARHDGGSSRFLLDAGGRGVTVDFAATVLGGVEVRVAKLSGVIALAPIISGYSVSSDEPLTSTAEGGNARVSGQRRTAPGEEPAELASGVLLLTCDTDVTVTGRCAPGAATALGAHSALPLLEFDALPVNDIRVAWLVGLGESTDRLQDDAARLELDWTDDGAQLRFKDQHRVLPWQREDPWAADQANQGVFRWAPPSY